MSDAHWEFDSECPKCGNITHVKCPVGEHVVRVHCEHCSHGYNYTHIVHEHQTVKEDND